MEKWGTLLLFLGLLTTVRASDPDLTTDLGINSTSASDFTFTGFRNVSSQKPGKAAPTFAQFNAAMNPVLGLTGLGLTAVLFEFGSNSQIDPHTHPRATEIFFVLTGKVDVGFVDTANVLFETTVQAGDLFVFPKGMLHFQRNNYDDTASGFSALSSENPGLLLIASALFTAGGTGLPDSVLSTAFDTSAQTVETIKKSISAASSAPAPATPSSPY